MKRILTVQDLSCVGKCSLTVALPIISALGIETCALPTALLSNHTAFKDFSFFDLSEQTKEIVQKMNNFKFDGIYAGYLGNIELIDTVCSLASAHSESVIFVDPVMGDNGKLYTGFTEEYPKKMRKLCAKANYIVPNITEAEFLLKKPINDVFSAAKELCELGPDVSVITGVISNNRTGAIAYKKSTEEFFEYYHSTIARSSHGTGDVFASVFFGKIINGFSVPDALSAAVDFTCASIEQTLDDEGTWYGVNFEKALPMLLNKQ